MLNKITCVLILSEKSSGSSTLQNELNKHPRINIVSQTRHSENETLYWNKAAILLGLKHEKLFHSELAFYDTKKAKKELLLLLNSNIENFHLPLPENDIELVFDGWKQLCTKFGPIFLEKTPNHLLSWAALETIYKCMTKKPEIEFKFIGLIRNPLDTLYSYWSRWKVDPEVKQFEWLNSYNNLLKWQEKVGQKLIIVKYEDLVSNKSEIQRICNFLKIDCTTEMGKGFHYNSVAKHKTDKYFGFQLKPEIIELASQFGYSLADLTNQNKSSSLWSIYRIIKKRSYRSRMIEKQLKSRLRTMYRRFK